MASPVDKRRPGGRPGGWVGTVGPFPGKPNWCPEGGPALEVERIATKAWASFVDLWPVAIGNNQGS